ncbi:TPA: hypothetical protein ACLFL5_000988, partial [Salmonella enterica subsp. houtenae serovar Houten]
PRPMAPIQGFEGRSPIAIHDIPVAFALGCKAILQAFAPLAYRFLVSFSCRRPRFSHHSWIRYRRRFTGPMFPLAPQSAYHCLFYSLKE